ncbi:MAG: succinate dehydrogenase, cytochrome b556 subunit [Caulobacteraceae bacterium]|nr:succinate dehydrogenase, cytochrome b556 subunit [Caulobacter sp.]
MVVGRAARAVRPPPLSPHLQVWRWHVTMAASIATRATGVALYVGALIAAAFAVCLAMGPDAYAGYLAVMGSALGKLVLFGLTVSVFYHLAAGLRHLAWDAGKGFQPGVADRTAIAAFAFGLLAAIATWAVAFMTGAA